MVGAISLCVDGFVGGGNAFAKKDAANRCNGCVYGNKWPARIFVRLDLCPESGVVVFRRQLEYVLAVGHFGLAVCPRHRKRCGGNTYIAVGQSFDGIASGNANQLGQTRKTLILE